MDLIRTLLSRFASLFQRKIKNAELDEELRAHIDMATKENIASGMSSQQARTAALRSFGGLEQIKEAYRMQREIPLLEVLMQDVSFALRILFKNPGFSLTATLTLALGIGASTAVFSLVNTILLKPLPYPNANRLEMLWRNWPMESIFGTDKYPWSPADFRLLKQAETSFRHLGAFKRTEFNLTGSANPELLDGVRASAGFFPALGVSPLLGRTFTEEEDRPGREHEIVLSYSLWISRFGGDHGAIGKTIDLNGYPYTVIGVMPASFAFPNSESMPPTLDLPKVTQLWVPLALDPLNADPATNGSSDMGMLAELKPGVGVAQMRQDLNLFDQRFAEQNPRAKGYSSLAVPLAQQTVADAKRPLLLLLGAVIIVLLVASANVAGLTLNRSLGRRKELTLRAALGAGRLRLVSQLMTESVMLAMAGGLLGIGFGQAALSLVKLYGPTTIPHLRETGLDPAVIVFAIGITLLTGVLFGLAPAFGATRMNMVEALKQGGQRSGGGASAPIVRNVLLVGQVAMALVLVVTAGLLVRTFYHMLNADSGFNADRVMTFKLPLPPSKYSEPARMEELYHQVLLRLQAIPGVESAGFASEVPMAGATDGTVIRIPGKPSQISGVTAFANYSFVSPGYFASIETPLQRGRDVADSDRLGAVPVTIINSSMAKRYWPGENPIGKQVGVGSTRYPVRTIVGVVADIKHLSLREATEPQMFVPYMQSEIKNWPSMQSMQFVLKTRADPASVTDSVRQAVHSVDPDLPVADLATLATIVDVSITADRFSMLLLSAFGVLALLLAAIGMFGVISWSVMQRTSEIGIRIALGAQRKQILLMILFQGGRLACAGIGIGLVAAFATTRLIARFLYGVQPTDPVTFAAVTLLLATVALLACYLPARRAMKIDPMRAIRLD